MERPTWPYQLHPRVGGGLLEKLSGHESGVSLCRSAASPATSAPSDKILTATQVTDALRSQNPLAGSPSSPLNSELEYHQGHGRLHLHKPIYVYYWPKILTMGLRSILLPYFHGLTSA